MVYNVMVTLSFEAESYEAAEEKAYNALSLIPAQDAPELYTVDTVYKAEGQK